MPGHALGYDDMLLATRALDQFGAELQQATPPVRRDPDFAHRGMRLFPISPDIATRLSGFFDESRRRSFSKDDCLPDYIAADLSEADVNGLNKRLEFFGPATDDAASALTEFLSAIAGEIEAELGHPWELVNARAWITPEADDFGPTSWHVDGFSTFATKMMIYPLPLNKDNGALEVYDRQGNKHSIETDYPACVLFDNASLLHRGRGGRHRRPAIEIQTIPAKRTHVAYVYAGQNARSPRNFAPAVEAALATSRFRPNAKASAPTARSFKSFIPISVKASAKRVLRRLIGQPELVRTARATLKITANHTAFLNIGGGAEFSHPGWVNLEEAVSAKNPISFRFDPQCVFPIRSGTIQTVYSSHCLEHLDDATVDRVLAEARRVISSDGTLVIKIPDFDEVLARWRSGDDEYFKQQWGLEAIAPTWEKKGLKDTIDTRTSMVFCGFWEDSAANHFNVAGAADAYHGPAALSGEQLRGLLQNSQPHAISQTLVERVKSSERDFRYNHQNAWGRDEFIALIERHGFKVSSVDGAVIRASHHDIPDIDNMTAITAYFEAKPV